MLAATLLLEELEQQGWARRWVYSLLSGLPLFFAITFTLLLRTQLGKKGSSISEEQMTL